MSRRKGNVTIADVARAAGVSVSTVSRVLNDKDDVAAETYERVQAVIKELGYTSSLAARSMRSRRTNVIGLIMPDVEDPFSVQVMKGVNHAIAEFDYDLIVYTGGSIKKKSPADRERHYVSLLNRLTSFRHFRCLHHACRGVPLTAPERHRPPASSGPLGGTPMQHSPVACRTSGRRVRPQVVTGGLPLARTSTKRGKA